MVPFDHVNAMMGAISDSDLAAFRADGFIVKRSFYEPAEMDALLRTFEIDDSIRRRAAGVDDGHGGATEISLWNEPGEDSFGALARGERIVNAATRLLGGEVYHYHSKITMKRPGAGGTWVWHQDFGYWYANGCLLPDMLTVAIPLNPMSEANGCLHVLAGSHRMGRIEHGRVGAQTGADPARVSQAERRFTNVAFEGQPGDVMFFHSNTLHTSAPNHSATPRNLLLVAFNTRENDPYLEHHHPRYTPIDVLPDRAILDRAGYRSGESRRFHDPADDHSAESFESLG